MVEQAPYKRKTDVQIVASPPKRTYNMGYKDCYGWFIYIPPRHKKRIQKYLKQRNKTLKKDHHKYFRLEDMLEIHPYKTVMYA